jgi:hypothetical protein
MAAKDFSIVAKVLLDAAGFTSGASKMTADAKALEKGINSSTTVIKKGFGELTNTALPALGAQFGALSGVFGGVKTAIMALVPAFRSVSGALMATGIGAIIIGISLAIAGLISWMKRTDEGGDTMRKVFTVIKSVIEVVLDKIAKLGSALYKISQGDFKGAWEDIKDAFTGWGQAMKDNIKTANELDAVQEKLETFNVDYLLKKAKLEEDISEKQLAARKKNEETGKLDVKANEELKKSKKALYDFENEHMQLQVDAAQKEYDMGAKTKEAKQKVNDLLAEQVGLSTAYNQSLKETEKLDNKSIETLEKRLQDLKKANLLIEGGTSGSELGKDLVGGGKAGEAYTKNLKFNAPDAAKTFFASDANANKVRAYTALTEKQIQAVVKLGQAYDNLDQLTNGLTSVFDTLFGNIDKGFKGVLEGFKQMLIQMVKEMAAKAAVFAILSLISGGSGALAKAATTATEGGLWKNILPHYASGGISGGGLSVVGENGPELLNLGKGAQVYNNFQTRNLLGNNNRGQYEFVIRGKSLVGVQNNFYRANNGF